MTGIAHSIFLKETDASDAWMDKALPEFAAWFVYLGIKLHVRNKVGLLVSELY